MELPSPANFSPNSTPQIDSSQLSDPSSIQSNSASSSSSAKSGGINSGLFSENSAFQVPSMRFDTVSTSSFKDTILSVSNYALDNILLVSGVLAVFFIVFAGLRFITAGGNQEAVKQARSTIINVIIGIVIIYSAFFVIRFAVGLGHTVTNSAN